MKSAEGRAGDTPPRDTQDGTWVQEPGPGDIESGSLWPGSITMNARLWQRWVTPQKGSQTTLPARVGTVSGWGVGGCPGGWVQGGHSQWGRLSWRLGFGEPPPSRELHCSHSLARTRDKDIFVGKNKIVGLKHSYQALALGWTIGQADFSGSGRCW